MTVLGGVRHGADHGRPGRHDDRQHRVAEVGEGHVGRPGRRGRRSTALARNAPLTRPRPGHADLVGHAEVRLRRGPAGPRARQRPRDRGAGRARRGRRRVPRAGRRRPARLATSSRSATAEAPGGRPCRRPTTSARLDADPVRCLDAVASAAMVAEIDQAHKDGDTLGGVVEVVGLRRCRPGSARTSTGTDGSTRGWPAR